LYVDFSVVVHALQNAKDGGVAGWRLVQEIRRLLELEWKIKEYYLYRETNTYVDALANIRCEHCPDLCTFV
jgi:hypothetical protein